MKLRRDVVLLVGLLLVGLLLVVVGLADWYNQRPAVKIRKLGGYVQANEDGTVSVFFEGPKVTDASLEDLKRLTNFRELNLKNTQVTDAGLEHLKALTNLGSLHVENTKVTDEGVEKLQQALPYCKIHH